MKLALVVIIIALTWLAPFAASAEIRREGEWPSDDPSVSLELEQTPRSEALKQLAKAAGWSIVVDSPSRDLIDVRVHDQPASRVLEILLSDRAYRVSREGSLLHVRLEPAPAVAPPEPAEPPAAAAATAAAATPPAPILSATPSPAAPTGKRGDDRIVTGGRTRVEAGEVVRDLVIMGGRAEVLGHVTGDLSIMGGSATLRPGARVDGDATVLGGTLSIEDDASIAGDVAVLGGKVDRKDGSDVGKISTSALTRASAEGKGLLAGISRALSRTALLFVFGAVLLALATRRMEDMEKEVAARPMRTFALGVVGLLLAAIAVLVLTVSIVGIPLAAVGAIAAVVATYVGIAAVLGTLGGALIHHKTDNAYAHLAVGCAAYLLLSSLPWIGGLVTLLVVVSGFGAIIATRGAGFYRKRVERGPYRTAGT